MTSFCMVSIYVTICSRTVLIEYIILLLLVVQYWQQLLRITNLHTLIVHFFNTVSAGRFCLS
jgi:hypothetical protein